MVVSDKVKAVLPHDPERHFQGLTQERQKHMHMKNCMKMFIVFIIVKNCKPSKCLSSGERIHKTMNHIPTTDNYAAAKGLTTDVS